MRILYIAYPLLTVSDESAGGAEQVLWTLEREMSCRGMKTTVAASAGSRVSGELFATGDPSSQPDDFERRNREHQERILEFIRRRAREGAAFDLVHDMSGSFWPRAAEIDAPLLATLHLPRTYYPPQFFDNISANVAFNCVSRSQAREFADLRGLAGVIGNGIAPDRFTSVLDHDGPRDGLLWLGRICEEKAPHLAIEIAERAGLPITVAGKVYPFSYHQQYFDREIAPRLQRASQVTFVRSPSQEIKLRLLRRARAVLVTSQVEETSSLVAMEAAACGAPVIVLARGALPEIVRNGETGFVVNTVDEAVLALQELDAIRPEACVRHAHEYFSGMAMAEKYAALYAFSSVMKA